MTRPGMRCAVGHVGSRGNWRCRGQGVGEGPSGQVAGAHGGVTSPERSGKEQVPAMAGCWKGQFCSCGLFPPSSTFLSSPFLFREI